MKLRSEDGAFLADQLNKQSAEERLFPLSEQDEKLLRKSFETVKATGGVVTVVVPEANESIDEDQPAEILDDARESIKNRHFWFKWAHKWASIFGCQSPIDRA